MSSKIAIVLCGFIRDKELSIDLFDCLKKFKSKIDIFYSCPNKCDDHDSSEIFTIQEQINIINKFKECKIVDNVNIEFYDYNMKFFMSEIHENNINIYSSFTNSISIRWLSMFYGINKSINLLKKQIENSNILYDYTVVSRPDFLENIVQFNPPQDLDKLYILRTSPYRVKEPDMHAEDRFFYGNTKSILLLESIYKFVIATWNDKDSWGEKIIYNFFKNHHNIPLEYQDGINIVTKINSKKYSQEFINYYKELYNTYINLNASSIDKF